MGLGFSVLSLNARKRWILFLTILVDRTELSESRT